MTTVPELSLCFEPQNSFAGRSRGPGTLQNVTPTKERLRSLTVDILVRCVFQRLQNIQLDEDGRAVLRFKSVTELAVEAWWYGTPTSSFTPSTQGNSPSLLPPASEPEPHSQQQIRLPPVPGPLHLHTPELDHRYQYAHGETDGCEPESTPGDFPSPKIPDSSRLPDTPLSIESIDESDKISKGGKSSSDAFEGLPGGPRAGSKRRYAEISSALPASPKGAREHTITEIDTRSPFHVDSALQRSLEAASENPLAKRCKLNLIS
ncbi:MAG: hypothetical protein Q9187_008204 [Circinaria calcarea]